MTQPQNRITRWCYVHPDEMVKRGTLRCRRCTVDLKFPKRQRLSVDPERLKPMRRADGHTNRSWERLTKGYAR